VLKNKDDGIHGAAFYAFLGPTMVLSKGMVPLVQARQQLRQDTDGSYFLAEVAVRDSLRGKHLQKTASTQGWYETLHPVAVTAQHHWRIWPSSACAAPPSSKTKPS
jgi:hypothetical protein